MAKVMDRLTRALGQPLPVGRPHSEGQLPPTRGAGVGRAPRLPSALAGTLPSGSGGPEAEDPGQGTPERPSRDAMEYGVHCSRQLVINKTPHTSPNGSHIP